MSSVHKLIINNFQISLAISLGIGGLSGLIIMIGKESFKNTNKPPHTPHFLFPIVLTILLWLLFVLIIKWVIFAAYLNIGLTRSLAKQL